MLDLITGVIIIAGLGFIGVLLKGYLVGNTSNELGNEDEDAFCEIDTEHVLMLADKYKAKDINELKRKLQDFKNRNRFYKM